MLEVAGGILIAFLIIAFLPYILEGIVWLLALGILMAVAAGAWFGISLMAGPFWATGISLAMFLAWLVSNKRKTLGGDKLEPSNEILGSASEAGPSKGLPSVLLKLAASAIAVLAAIVSGGLLANYLGDIGILIGVVICVAVPIGIAVLWERHELSRPDDFCPQHE